MEPWYHSALELDRAGPTPPGWARRAWPGPSRAAQWPRCSVFVAAATDPVIGGAMVRFWHLLATPAELMTDAELMTRMAEVMANPDDYPPPERVGPTREALLEALADPEEALHA